MKANNSEPQHSPASLNNAELADAITSAYNRAGTSNEVQRVNQNHFIELIALQLQRAKAGNAFSDTSKYIARNFATETLRDCIQPDGGLFNEGRYISWSPGDKTITLDCEFTIGELKALAWWICNTSPKQGALKTMITIEQIAEVCHEANRAYCSTIGDNSQPTWAEAPEWQRTSIVNGVRFHLVNPTAGR